MKNLIVLFICILSLDVMAKGTDVDVLSAEYGLLDHQQNKTLCLTVVRVPETSELLGIVEDIHDCYYARLANHSPNHRINLDLKKLRSFEVRELEKHLQSLDSQLEFLFSDGE